MSAASPRATAPVAERVALVTGGARGIGAAVSRALARAGLRLVINYQSSEAAAVALADELVADGAPRPRLVRADVADPRAVREMVQSIRTEEGRLDLLVNNAGILHEALVAFTSPEQLWRVMQVNLGGVFNCCKSALPLLGRGQGRIVNVASIAGEHGTEGLAAYAASKAAIIALTKVLAREVAGLGLSVNAVAPGLVDTDMPAGMLSGEARQRAIAAQPIKRLGRPEEVAQVVRFLALEAPAYLTGEVIRVDGGALIGG